MPVRLRLARVAALSLAVLVVGYVGGRLADCSPHQMDGQCGLSSFLGLMAGLLGGVVVLLAGCLLVILDWVSDRKRKRTFESNTNPSSQVEGR